MGEGRGGRARDGEEGRGERVRRGRPREGREGSLACTETASSKIMQSAPMNITVTHLMEARRNVGGKSRKGGEREVQGRRKSCGRSGQGGAHLL